MQDLIERLEAAECGSRELDREVCEATGWGVHNAFWILPATTSLDAALALAERVLPDHKFAIVKDDGPDAGPKFRWSVQVARYNLEGPVGRNSWWFGVSDTPALALCIAILKATTAISVGTDGEAGSEPK